MEISVVIPVYNKKDYIARCLEQILAQDFPSFEVIAVDDGSTDGSGDICDSIAQNDNRLRVIHTENQGVTAARRRGVEESCGKYIIFSDADDEYLLGAFSVMHKAIEDSGADEVICVSRTQKGQTLDSGRRGWQDVKPLIIDLLCTHNSFCVLWAIIFQRELLTGCLDMSRDIVNSEDILMQIKCLMKHPKVYFIGDEVYRYNVGVPNERRSGLQMVRAFDEELKLTLQPEWSTYADFYLLNRIKRYESFICYRQFHVFETYYKELRKEDLSRLPIADRIAFMLPPRIAFIPIWIRKRIIR